MSEHKFNRTLAPANITALWGNRAYTTIHPMPTPQQLQDHVAKGEYPRYPAIPEYFLEADEAGFTFQLSYEAGQGWYWSHPEHRSTQWFTTLAACAVDANWHRLGLARAIYSLQSMGVQVRPGLEAWYWHNEKDSRFSALFHTLELAWRDAIRVNGLGVKEGVNPLGRAARFGQSQLVDRTGLANAKTDTMGDNVVQDVYAYDPNLAPGEPYPAVGTDVVVTPHNTQWGFSVVSDYLCTVLAYDGDYVWLRVAHYDGPHSGSRISTRVDKVDFRPSEEQP